MAVARGRTCWQRTLGIACQVRSSSSSSPAQPSASFYDSTVERYAAQPVEVLSLFQMLHYGRDAWRNPGKITKSARFVQRELPKRLARRLLDLQLLPHIVVSNPHVKRVYDSYYSSFNLLRRHPPVRTLEDNAAFCELLRQLLDTHVPMLDALAQGLREVKSKQLVGACLQLDAFFDSMLRSRISRRVLAEQHLQLGTKRPGYVGILCTDLNVADAVDFAAQRTRQVCMETYGHAPEFQVTGDKDATIPYIPSHLDYMLYELLKNAARATVEHHRRQQGSSHNAGPEAGHRSMAGAGASRRGTAPALAPIHIRICGSGPSSRDLTLKICDQGGGIPSALVDQVWSYGFTTVGGIPAGYLEGGAGGGPQLSTQQQGGSFLVGAIPADSTAARYGPAVMRMASGQVLVQNQAPGLPTGSAPDTWHSADALHHAYNQHTRPDLDMNTGSGQQPVAPVEEWDPEGPGSSGSAGIFISGDNPGTWGGGAGAGANGITTPFALGLPDRHAATESMFSHWSSWDPGPTAGAGPYSGGGGALVSTTALQHALQVQAAQQQQQQKGSRQAGFGWANRAADKVYTLHPKPPEGSEASGAPFMMLGGEQGPQQDGRYRMAGLGFGLPLSRLHARYFGGDLVLQVVPGYGVDAFLTISRLVNTEWQEQAGG